MYTKGLVTIVIPSRNEIYLTKTIRDLLEKATGNIEIIAVIDGVWPTEIVDDKRVIYLKHGGSKGMRASINHGVAISHGEYILKCDAHTMWDKGYDEVLKADCEDNWVVVPRRYALDPEKWEIEKRSDNKYPVDVMLLSADMQGVIWEEENRKSQLSKPEDSDYDHIVLTMSSQGSAWFMKRSYYDFLELLDEETYGKFYKEFQEISLKAYLSGGKCVTNKATWYAHHHKTQGRGYSMDKGEEEKANKAINRWKTEKMWHKQIYSFNDFIAMFKPVPTWK